MCQKLLTSCWKMNYNAKSLCECSQLWQASCFVLVLGVLALSDLLLWLFSLLSMKIPKRAKTRNINSLLLDVLFFATAKTKERWKFCLSFHPLHTFLIDEIYAEVKKKTNKILLGFGNGHRKFVQCLDRNSAVSSQWVEAVCMHTQRTYPKATILFVF